MNENSDGVIAYRKTVPFNKALVLASLAVPDGETFDAVVSPPSSRDDAIPYREACIKRGKMRDLSQRFTRKGAVKAATADTLQEMIGEFVYEPGGDEKSITSLLIVDESLASGRSAAAVLHYLRTAGLPETCKVTVAVAALLAPNSSAKPANPNDGPNSPK